MPATDIGRDEQTFPMMEWRMYGYMKSIGAGGLLAASIAGAAVSQQSGAGYSQAWPTGGLQPQARQYCTELLGTFDKYTASRATESSDGAHNHVRLGAEIACDKGDCAYCAVRMQALLKHKHFNPPALPSEIGQAP
jgi:hypothetical protein